MAALCRIGYPTLNKFAFASGMESRNLRTVAELPIQIVVVIRELANCQSPNQDGLPGKIPFDQTQQLYRQLALFDELRSTDSLSNCPDRDYALFDAVKKHGLIVLSNHHFSGVILAMIKLRMRLLTALGHSRPLESDSESGSSPGESQRGSAVSARDGNHLMINNLERCITDRMGFHTSRYVYQAGFESFRLLTSIDNRKEKIWFRSSRIDTGGVGSLFRVDGLGCKDAR
jgi:hypothetical protein